MAGSGDGEVNTALHLASYDGHLEAVRIIVEKGANVNQQGMHGWRPVHYACQNGSAAVVRYLVVEKGANAEATTRFGSTPLHLACGAGNLDAARILVDEGQVAVDPVDRGGERPVKCAAFAHQPNGLAVVQFLARRGADISGAHLWAGTRQEVAVWLERAQSWGSLHLACDGGDIEEVRRLLHSTDDVEDVDVRTSFQYMTAKTTSSTDEVVIAITDLLRKATGPWRCDREEELGVVFPRSFQEGVLAMRAVKDKANIMSKEICRFADDKFVELILQFCGRTWFKQDPLDTSHDADAVRV